MLEAEVGWIWQGLHTLVPSTHHCTVQPLIKQGSFLELTLWAWTVLFWLVHFACASSPKSIYNLWFKMSFCRFFCLFQWVVFCGRRLHLNFNFGGCFQPGFEWAVLGKPQFSCNGARADAHSRTAATLLCSSTHCFCFLSRSVSPDLKSFAVGIETLGGRVLGKT